MFDKNNAIKICELFILSNNKIVDYKSSHKEWADKYSSNSFYNSDHLLKLSKDPKVNFFIWSHVAFDLTEKIVLDDRKSISAFSDGFTICFDSNNERIVISMGVDLKDDIESFVTSHRDKFETFIRDVKKTYANNKKNELWDVLFRLYTNCQT